MGLLLPDVLVFLNDNRDKIPLKESWTELGSGDVAGTPEPLWVKAPD